MPRIPVFTSRVSTPAPNPGLGDDLAKPGRALAQLGGAIVGFGEDLARKAAREKAAAEEAMQQKKEEEEKSTNRAQLDRIENKITEAHPEDPADPEEKDLSGTREKGETGGKAVTPRMQDYGFAIPDGANGVAPEEIENVKGRAFNDVAELLVPVGEDAELSLLRTVALARGTEGGDADGVVDRSMAIFDEAAGPRAKANEDAGRRTHREAQVQDHRAILRARAVYRRNMGMVAVLNARLEGALGNFAEAVRQDPAVLTAMLKKGADAIGESAELAGLDPERAEAMQQGWSKQVHQAQVEGAIARNPALARTSLEKGEFDVLLGNDTVLVGRLTRHAENAKTVMEAREERAAKSRQSAFALQKADHLADIRKTSAGDPEFTALARETLDPAEMATFEAETGDAEVQHAARAQYAFMTPKEIAADIKQKAPGGDLSDTGERARGDKTRKAARDEVLAERKKDSAGWAMGDETVAAAIATAEEALENAEPGTPEAEQANREYRRALALRNEVQKDMGATPRLLSEDERESLTEELAGMTPTEQRSRLAELKRLYGDDYKALAKELSGNIAPDTAILMAHADDPALVGALARGMEMDGVDFKGARMLSLPQAGGKLDKSRLEDKQLYTFMVGDRVVRVVYDRKADALVPALVDSGGIDDNSGQPGRIRSGIHGAGQEIANVVAAVPKSQAFFAAEIARATLEDMLAIQAGGEPFWVHRDHADKATIFRFRHASPEERMRMLAEQASVFPQDSAFFKFGEAISEFARETLPTNPEFEDELFQKLMRAGGSLGGFIIVGGALRRAGVPPVISVAATGATTQMVAQFESALRKGATMEEAYEAANLGKLVGLTEAVPITRLFDRLDKGTGGSIRRALTEAAKGGIEEALQETFETIMISLIESDLVGYAPESRMFEGVGENAGIGFTLGGLANYVAAIAGGRRNAGGQPTAAPNEVDSATPEQVAEGTSSAGETGANDPQARPNSGKRENSGDDFRRAWVRRILRSIVERLPPKQRAQFDAAEFLDRAEYPLPGQTAQQYFAPVWDRLDPHIKAFLEARYHNFAGQANERIVDETLDVAGFKTSTKFADRKLTVPKDSNSDAGTETRIPDVRSSQKLKQLLGGLIVVPEKSDKPVAIEVKGQSAKRNKKQRDNDAALTRKGELAAVEVLRVSATKIEPRHLADVIEGWLNHKRRAEKKRPGDVPRAEIEQLIKTLRAQRGPDGKPLSVGVVIAITLSFALPLAYPGSGEAEDSDSSSRPDRR